MPTAVPTPFDTLQGCEYAALVDQIFKPISSGTLSVGQLQVEMHLGAAGAHPLVTIQRLLKHADAAGFRTFHKERNHWGCSGYQVSSMHAATGVCNISIQLYSRSLRKR
jgi:hypothetical protein